MTMADTGHPHWDRFLEAIEAAIAPTTGDGTPDRTAKARNVLPPVVLLVDERTDQDAYQLDRALLDWHDGRYSHVEPVEPDGTPTSPALLRPVCGDISLDGLKEGIQPRTGRLKLPNFSLARRVVEALQQDRAHTPTNPAELRAYCYTHECGPVRRKLWEAAGNPADGDGFTLAGLRHMLLGWLVQDLFLWWWGRRRTRRLLRSKKHRWYAEWVNGSRSPLVGPSFFAHAFARVNGLITGNAPAGVSPEERERRLEQMLLRALLTDLKRWGRAGRLARLSPWRRRRVTRYVLPLHLPPGAAAERGARFLEEYAAAARAIACGPVLVIADCPADVPIHGAQRQTLSEAANTLGAVRDAGRAAHPLLVELPDGLPRGVPNAGREPIRRVVSPGAEATVWWAVAAVIVGAVPWWLLPLDSTACLGVTPGEDLGEASETGSSAEFPRLDTAYNKARGMIDTANLDADAAEEAGATVRTVAYVGPGVNGGEDEVARRSDGAVPQLRGVALAQEQLNNEADGDDSKVWLRVKVYDLVGEDYQDAETVAKTIADDVEADMPEIIGVVGFTQSRRETREAVRILTEADIPVITTTTTADEMDPGRYFHAMAPANTREAGIVSRFARRANLIEESPGACVSAEAALVVKDPTDLYSESIGEKFASAFKDDGGEVQELDHTPVENASAATSPVDNPTEIAEQVCEAVSDEPRTIVYWAARNREFQAMLDSYDSTPCSDAPLTVVGGGSELTNAVLSGSFDTPDWLRLYYTTHVLPFGHEQLSTFANDFNDDYAEEFGDTDPWRNDGHAALAYDAMQVVAEAANKALETAGENLDRVNVQQSLDSGQVARQGASGYLAVTEDDAFLRDKPVVLLHHTDDGFEAVLYCGLFSNDEDVTTWGPEETDCRPEA
jgi:ABC-type branched-subunit amino acid transport system substrate-binding protein